MLLRRSPDHPHVPNVCRTRWVARRWLARAVRSQKMRRAAALGVSHMSVDLGRSRCRCFARRASGADTAQERCRVGAMTALRKRLGRERQSIRTEYALGSCTPEALNALSDALMGELVAKLREFDADETLRAAVVTGTGKAPRDPRRGARSCSSGAWGMNRNHRCSCCGQWGRARPSARISFGMLAPLLSGDANRSGSLAPASGHPRATTPGLRSPPMRAQRIGRRAPRNTGRSRHGGPRASSLRPRAPPKPLTLAAVAPSQVLGAGSRAAHAGGAHVAACLSLLLGSCVFAFQALLARVRSFPLRL